MKTKRFFTVAIILCGCYGGLASAQQTTLAADQNPRFMESQAKYSRIADTLTTQQGTTLQDTYKAYDWYEARQECRQQNRQWRYEETLNGYYNYAPSWSVFGNYGYPLGGYGYGSRWGRGGWGGRSHIGIGFGW